MPSLPTAILSDDRAAVRKLLAAKPALAMTPFPKAKLHRDKIFHWLYVGDTPLHLAAAGYRVEIIRMLLKAGADVNAAGNHRRSTPLHYAADGFITGPVSGADRQVRTLRVLLDAGADLHAQDKNGATALHRAVRTRCAAAVEFLLDAGAKPTLPNRPGSTPFHLAVQDTGRGGSGAAIARDAQRRIIQTFLTRGVSCSLQDGRGKTVLHSARSPWVREMLEKGSTKR